MNRFTTLALLFTVAMAGCLNPAQSLPAEADVTFDGAGNGDQSDRAQCDSEASISGNGEIQDGFLTITVDDDQGGTVYSGDFSGDFNTGDMRLSGHSGEWTLHAERNQDDFVGDEFTGSYAFFLNCAGI